MIKLSVSEVNINIPKRMREVRSKKFWLFAGSTWRKLLDRYVPYMEGQLSGVVNVTASDSEATIEYKAAYSLYVYNGKYLNFRKIPHPLACAEWDKVAIPFERKKLIRSMQNFIDAGLLGMSK